MASVNQNRLCTAAPHRDSICAQGSATCQDTGRVAVVAVHGVSNIEPYSTVRMIASLLLNLKVNDGTQTSTRFTPFQEVGFHVDVSAVPETQPANAGNINEGTRSWFGRLQKQFKNYGDWLQGRQAPAYSTLRLEGQRRDDATHTPNLKVDLYEMYWSDLSRLAGGVLSIFTAIYQLVFHSAQLGLETVEDARDYLRASKSRWRYPVEFVHWILSPATWGLTTVLPMLCVILGMFLSVEVEAPLMKSLGGLAPPLATVLVVAAIIMHIGIMSGVEEALVCTVPGVAITAWVANFGQHQSWIAHVIWTAAVLIAGGTACWLMFRRRQDQDGTIRGAIVSVVGCAILVFISGFWKLLSSESDPVDVIVERVYQALESVVLMMYFTWTFVLLLVTVVALWAGFVWIMSRLYKMVRGDIKELERFRLVCTRSISTGFIGLLISVVSFYWVTLLSFFMLSVIVKDHAGDLSNYRAVWGDFLITHPHEQLVVQWDDSLKTYTDEVFVTLFSKTVGWTIAGQIFAGAAVTFLFLPSICCDAFNVFINHRAQRLSTHLGNWLSFSFKMIYLVAAVILIFGPGLEFVANLLQIRPIRGFSLDHWASKTNAYSIINNFKLEMAQFAVSGVGLYFLSQWLEKNLRTPLGLILDVDNYLQTSYSGPTPRARMLTRYAGLLKYLTTRPDPANPDRPYYSRIVIAAHSQGTTLTADMLKFLNLMTAENEPSLVFHGPNGDVNLDIRLLTFGSPLRQLYGWRFPVQYGWARPDLPLFDMQAHSLGVRLWINCYCSGDYIGRDLWRHSKCESVWSPGIYAAGCHHCYDICLGFGAHTHYWDGTIVQLAEILDELIAEKDASFIEPNNCDKCAALDLHAPATSQTNSTGVLAQS